MSKEKESPTITMTEEQLERVIKTAVKNALYEMKNEEKELPGLQEDERKAAPASYSLIGIIASAFLSMVALFTGVCVYACGKIWYENGFSWILLISMFDFVFITVLAVISAFEIYKTKKIEVLNTVFSAIMALASLIVAIVGAVFAYKAL